MRKERKYEERMREKGYYQPRPWIPAPEEYQKRFWKFVKKLRKEYQEER